MRFYEREKDEVVVASAAKLDLLLSLFREKQINNPEVALRVEAPLFRAFHSFSNREIEEAVEEAKKAGADTVTLEAFKKTQAEVEAEEAAAAPPPAPAPAPEPAPAPAPEPAPAPAKPVFDNN